MYNQNYLIHYGKIGMRWGHRTIARSEAGLKRLDSGKHVSIGFGKKRQEAYDSRDRQILESRIAKTKKSLDANEERKKNERPLTKDEKKQVAYGALSSIVGGVVMGTVASRFATSRLIKIGATAVGVMMGSSIVNKYYADKQAESNP